jgi:hypothetical protein
MDAGRTELGPVAGTPKISAIGGIKLEGRVDGTKVMLVVRVAAKRMRVLVCCFLKRVCL